VANVFHMIIAEPR